MQDVFRYCSPQTKRFAVRGNPSTFLAATWPPWLWIVATPDWWTQFFLGPGGIHKSDFDCPYPQVNGWIARRFHQGLRSSLPGGLEYWAWVSPWLSLCTGHSCLEGLGACTCRGCFLQKFLVLDAYTTGLAWIGNSCLEKFSWWTLLVGCQFIGIRRACVGWPGISRVKSPHVG